MGRCLKGGPGSILQAWRDAVNLRLQSHCLSWQRVPIQSHNFASLTAIPQAGGAGSWCKQSTLPPLPLPKTLEKTVRMPEVRLTFRAGGAAHVLAAGCAVEAAGAAVVAAPEGHRPIAHAEVARARLAAASMGQTRTHGVCRRGVPMGMMRASQTV